MSRVVRIETAHRSRQRILQGIALALRRAASGASEPAEQRDLLAFLDLSLGELRRSVEETAAAWERRGYWLKADRFRHDWKWTERIGMSMSSALGAGDFDRAMGSGIELATHLQNVRLPAALSRSRPWDGGWEKRNGSTKASKAY
jgi:hypothetical protein